MKKIIQGEVIKILDNQSALVKVEKITTHPLYKKKIRKTKQYLVQKSINVKIGNKVIIEECRPLSKRKRFIIKSIVK